MVFYLNRRGFMKIAIFEFFEKDGARKWPRHPGSKAFDKGVRKVKAEMNVETRVELKTEGGKRTGVNVP